MFQPFVPAFHCSSESHARKELNCHGSLQCMKQLGQHHQQGHVLTLPAVGVQRYISTRPMFIDVRELSAGAAASAVTDAASAGVALRDLSQQYKGLLTAVKEEALIMEQVFPCPRTALAIFVQRIFEQRVQVRPLCAPWHQN